MNLVSSTTQIFPITVTSAEIVPFSQLRIRKKHLRLENATSGSVEIFVLVAIKNSTNSKPLSKAMRNHGQLRAIQLKSPHHTSEAGF